AYSDIPIRSPLERQYDRAWRGTRVASRSGPYGGVGMPEQQQLERARRDKRAGKARTTQAGEFVREEMHHLREGKHGARSTKQAIAIGLSKARRAGVPLPPPPKGAAKPQTRKSAERAYEVGQGMRAPRAPSKRRGRAIEDAL